MLRMITALFVFLGLVSVIHHAFDGGPFTQAFWRHTIGVSGLSAVLIALLFRFIKKHG